MVSFSTKAVHFQPDRKDPYGALNLPLYNSVAFEFESAEEIEMAFQGKKKEYVYTRSTNPTPS